VPAGPPPTLPGGDDAEQPRHQFSRPGFRVFREPFTLFGSYGRGTPSRRSDIDILVSFTETPSLFAFVRLKRELEQRLGRRVDLVMREALRPSIGRRILAEVVDA
jgi:predicted nucleotidyltransferase